MMDSEFNTIDICVNATKVFTAEGEYAFLGPISGDMIKKLTNNSVKDGIYRLSGRVSS